MITAPQDIQSSDMIAIKIVHKDSEMMDCFADSVNMEEDQDILGGGVMVGLTAECSQDVKKTMEPVIVSTMGLWCIPNVSQAIHTLAAVFVGLILQIVLPLE